MAESVQILVVDDESDNFDVLEALLADEDYDLHYAASGLRALERLKTLNPDVIVLDLMMPGIDGIQVCRQIRANPPWQAIPIIVVTALTAQEDLAASLDAGANDYLTKPVNRIELKARLRSLVRLNHQQRQIQHLNQQLTDFNTLLEKRVKARTKRLEQMINYDALTKLPSKAFLLAAIAPEIATATPALPCALVYLNCDQFHLINDSLGYEVGDQLLRAIVQRLKTFLSRDIVLARVGGDEFCYLLPHVQGETAVIAFAQAVIDSFQQPYVLTTNYSRYVTICAGITLAQDAQTTPQELLRQANTALCRAKGRGHGHVQVFERQMHQMARQRLKLESDMMQALERQEFLVHYQPIINLKTNRISGFEALVRWQHPEGGMVSPGEFIPCAEETGLIVPIGILVLERACYQLQIWQQEAPTLFASVNLSVRQFTHPTLLEDIYRVLEQTQVDPRRLKLEITESAIVDKPQVAIALTEELRSHQIQLSIDDFGTGYSSLSYLNQFPVDTLKIDQSFIRAMLNSTRNTKLVRSILKLGQALGMSIVAEGIETEEQLRQLQDWGCEYGQGYFLGRPLDPKEIAPLLQAQVTVPDPS
ncbi:putative bifunctional diguanylate cyclase/phosphodiesterase [Leptolyngbya sp. PCC 6406]|uniref:putative bifunctional diguanylate cyclase/phosphodiesterase n=1 Tax=Leptolyngbya sp. PCC 6406 TaxID=1173264 RepID=UPI0002AC5053|nr:EAL domain-containing response regulator [Leptolyngbya sp. PCC 6406]